LFAVLWICLYWPGGMIIITSSLLLGFSLYVFREMELVEKSEKAAEDHASQTEEMQEMLGDQRRMVKSTEHVSRLEERNRLAARIHDEIGHGMSGSILLLEGAALVMDSDPEKARSTIQTVTENLRESVEEIRKVLREERSASADVNLARIENELTSFAASHPMIKTRFETDGDMSDVNGAVWICVYENMIEALTNVLKHSSATLFSVKIVNSAGLLCVEFSDNGGAAAAGEESERGKSKNRKTDKDESQGQEQVQIQGHGQIERHELKEREIKPGIGLQNMEERAALCYGRCFFRHEPDGFHILMTFPRKSSL